jgi:fructokinase
VGIGIPGSVDPATGLAKGASSTWLNGKPVETDLRRALGRDVRIANDADCFAVSEAVDGSGAGHNVVFAVILGSGAGAGVAVGVKAHHGPNNSAGEWGHNPLPRPDVTEIPVPPAIAADTDAWSDGSPAGPLPATTTSTPVSTWPPPHP